MHDKSQCRETACRHCDLCGRGPLYSWYASTATGSAVTLCGVCVTRMSEKRERVLIECPDPKAHDAEPASSEREKRLVEMPRHIVALGTALAGGRRLATADQIAEAYNEADRMARAALAAYESAPKEGK